MSLIMPGNPRTRQPISTDGGDEGAKKKKKAGGSASKKDPAASSLLVIGLKRLLPVGLNLFAGKEQELVQHCKDRFLSKMEEEEILEFCKNQLTLPNKYDPSDELCWQHHLYSTLGNKQCVSADEMKAEELELLINRIVAMGKVLYGLHIVSLMKRCINVYLNPNCFRLTIHQSVESSSNSLRLFPSKESELL